MRKEKAIADGAVRVTAKNEMLCVERMCEEESSVRLWVNLTDHAVERPENSGGKILFANRFDGTKVNEKGFVVIK